jgi:phosphopantothenoylcysteine synthetase/decarboxylase
MTVSFHCERKDFFQTMTGEGGLELPLSGVSVGVTAGPTRAWIDPVRYLANASTGLLGALIADRLASLGAQVTTILGPGSILPTHPSVQPLHIETPVDLLDLLKRIASSGTELPVAYWVHAMAVLDYIPVVKSTGKIPSDLGEWSLSLKPTPKIIQHLKVLFPQAGLIGFKLTSSSDPEVLQRAAIQLADSAQCDLVVANPPPFEASSIHKAWFWERECASWTGPIEGKPEIAHAIVTWICRHTPAGHPFRA